jgi:hypothetical protein
MDLLHAQAGALTTQLGTLAFNYLEQRDAVRAQIRQVMGEIKVLQAAKKEGE